MLEKVKKRIKDNLLLKILKLKREVKIYKNKITDDVLREQDYIDKINLLQDDIRSLILKLNEEDRECWLKERNRENERDTPKEKRVKKEINDVKNN